MQLIEVNNKVIGTQTVQSVSARDLYLGLGLASAVWSRWSQSNIVENEFFSENTDWVGFNIMMNGNETRDFAVTIEFAKHIAMMARTQKAHEYRNYFIECENKAKAQTAVSGMDVNKFALEQAPLALVMAKAFGFEGNQALLSADKAINNLYGISPLRLMGAELVSDQERYLTPTEIGVRLGGISARKVNTLLLEHGLQFKYNDVWTPTAAGKSYAVLLDTGKKHSGGTPVQQLKWRESVVATLEI